MTEVSKTEASQHPLTASLHIRNYRLLFASQGVSLTGTSMQNIAQAYLVLHLTNDYLAMGLVVALQYLPVLIFGAAAGVVADRFNKRRILQLTDSASAVVALFLAVLVATGSVRVWQVYVLAFLLGMTNMLNQPAVQSFNVEVVGQELVTNAVGLNMMELNVSRTLGPLLAGVLLYAAGFSACFFINAASYWISLACLAAMRIADLHPSKPAAREHGQVRAGLRYVWATPKLRTTLFLMAVVGVFTFNFPVTLPLLGKEIFADGPLGFTLLFSCFGVGGMIGSLLVASHRSAGTAGLEWIGIAFGALVLLVAAMPWGWAAALACVIMGVAAFGFASTAGAILQGAARPDMRGRVMALWLVAVIGSFPIGAPLMSWVAKRTGARGSLVLGGVVCIVVCCAYLVHDRVRAARSPEIVTPSPATT